VPAASSLPSSSPPPEISKVQQLINELRLNLQEKKPMIKLTVYKTSNSFHPAVLSTAYDLSLAVEAALKKKKSTLECNRGREKDNIDGVFGHLALICARGEHTLLEVSLWLLHTLSLAVRDETSKRQWRAANEKLTKDRQDQHRECVELLDTLFRPECRKWFFQYVVDVTNGTSNLVPFSAFLGTTTRAYIRRSPPLLTELTQKITAQKLQTCKEVKKAGQTLPKPAVKRPCPSEAQDSTVYRKVLGAVKVCSTRINVCLARLSESMNELDRETFVGRLQDIPDHPTADDAVDFSTQPPLLKRFKQEMDDDEEVVEGGGRE